MFLKKEIQLQFTKYKTPVTEGFLLKKEKNNIRSIKCKITYKFQTKI